jgi:hypothetical protein
MHIVVAGNHRLARASLGILGNCEIFDGTEP